MDERQDFLGYRTVITSQRHLFDLKLGQLWAYRDLVLLFVKRDFTSRYKQTVLGPAWALIQPLMTTVIFTLVFGSLAGLSAGNGVPPFLFYLGGTISWQYFAGCLTQTSATFLANSHIMGKVYFPRLVVPVATVITQLISYAISWSMFLVMLLGSCLLGMTPWPDPGLLWLWPAGLLQMACLGLGCGITVSALTTKYRDLQMLVSFGVQLWMYATPVAYSLEVFQDSPLLPLLLANPMTMVIEGTRLAFLGSGAGSLRGGHYLASWLVTLALFILGLGLFTKVEKNFMDTI